MPTYHGGDVSSEGTYTEQSSNANNLHARIRKEMMEEKICVTNQAIRLVGIAVLLQSVLLLLRGVFHSDVRLVS